MSIIFKTSQKNSVDEDLHASQNTSALQGLNILALGNMKCHGRSNEEYVQESFL